jgi:hypothetical protein
MTPSGQRIWRTVSKHLPSSIKLWMFSIIPARVGYGRR